jgi:hypothetical protein
MASIQILDDDSLLNVFYFCRPFLLGEDQDDEARLWGGKRQWVGEHWWCKLTHVCQRWRNVILCSPSYLGICQVCTYGTPVADMLAHSPPLPLVIDYFDECHGITTEDEDEIVLALKQRNRVRRVRLHMPVTNLQKLVMAIDEEYPSLEYLVIMHRTDDNSTTLIFPEAFQAPRLRHLLLIGFALPLGPRLLLTGMDLVTLCLFMDHPSTYFQPNTLLQWISFMPQLETLVIVFVFPVPNRDVERQLMYTPITSYITLPHLRWFVFQGVSAYLEAVVRRITAPRLEKLQIDFFNQLTFSISGLLQFINRIENLSFESAKFEFSKGQVYVEVYPRGETELYALSIAVGCWHHDWQVFSVAQISNRLSQMFSAVEHLTLEHEVHDWSSEEHSEVDRIEWRYFLSSFSNVKTLHIDDGQHGLVEELSRCLQSDDGELSFELLPELQELKYSGSYDTYGTFTSFIDIRQNIGRPVTLSFVAQAQTEALLSPFETSSITPVSSEEVGNDFYT